MQVNKYIMILILICIIVCINSIRNSKLKKSPTTFEKIELARKFLREIQEARKDYFTYTIKENIKANYRNVYKYFCKNPYSKIRNNDIIEFKSIYVKMDTLIKQWNSEFINNELSNNKNLFDNIDGKSLDIQQRKAVVIDEDNNLVLAGAGSGKTLTISAKVKYLVDRKNILPKEILLISFTKKAAEEMQERVSKKLNIDAEAKTFHKLGLNIITEYKKARPDVANEKELENVIDMYFNEHIFKNKKQLQLLITFFGYYLNIPKDMEEFKNLGESYDFYRNVDFETIKGKVEKQVELKHEINTMKENKKTIQGETVKSLEELMIANFLYINGINYEYEHEYPYLSDDPYRKKYRPDFYLTDYDIYIEHFGITKDNRVPWLSEIEEIKYLEGIKWKREFHKKNKTKLLETYSYYNKDGVLLEKLEEKLKQANVKFKERDFKEIYEKVFDNKNDKYFIEFKKLISSFINLFKSNGYEEESFKNLKDEANKIKNIFLRQRSNIFLEIVKPIYIQYRDQLLDKNLVDFNDMINEATEIVRQGNILFNYKYIIIDEYQDISTSRFRLIKEIKNKTNAKVMCVGDDWQSIYRFAGSDISLFTDFEKYFGFYELLKIESTYRNSQELIDIAGNFIMKNSKQFKKDLKSAKHHSNPIRIINYEYKISEGIKKAIEEIVYQFGDKAQITILGRNNFDIEAVIKDNNGFYLNKSRNQILVTYSKYPELVIDFLTVHKAKGLEADNIILINMENKLIGFPNKISDDPILALVLSNLDNYNFAEERRLFYVALTRTKNVTYLMAPLQGQSIFCEELTEEFHINQEPVSGINVPKKAMCPKCKKGYLVIRENSHDGNVFLGCSNYPFCDESFKQIEIINNQIRCNVCGGYMVKRCGKYGEFYGCTNYPYCKNKLEIRNIGKFKKA